MLLARDEIQKSIANYGWSYKNKTIHKSFQFDNYMDGITFVNKIAELAERLNHHPDLTIGWCRVEVTITSHDLGGVSTKCINLATGVEDFQKN